MWQKYPLVRLAVPFTLGMYGANLLIRQLIDRVDMLFTLMACLLMAAVVCHTVVSRRPLFRHIFATSLFLLFLLFGASLYIIRYRSVAQTYDVRRQVFCGIVSAPPRQKPHTVGVQLKLPDGALLLAFLQSDSLHPALQLQRGDTVRLQALHTNSTCPLLRSDRLIATADTSALGSYTSHLFFQGISATCYAPADCWTTSSPTMRDTTWNERLHLYYTQSDLDSVTASMVEALTIGRRERLPLHLRSSYSAAGVSHVLALSGMHLALLIAILNLLCFRFLLYEQRRWAMLAVIPLIWTFTYVAGTPPSLLRATVMATFVQLGFVADRPKSVVNALALAAIVMLTYNPLLLHDVGAQLSFVAMAGISVIFVPAYLRASPSARATMPHIPWLYRILQHFLSPIMLTVSATLFTAPLIALHFGQLPVYSLVTNLIVPTLVTLLIYVSVAWLLFFWCSPLHHLLGSLLDGIVSVQNSVVQSVASWPGAVVYTQPDLLTVLLYYLLLAILLHILRHHTRFFSPQN